MHEITENLEQLQRPIAEGESVSFFVMGRHQDVPSGVVHGFGIVIERSGRGEAKGVSGSSDGEDSTYFRGVLGAVLTSLEWAEKNCLTEVMKTIYSSNDPIYFHLPREIKKWVADANHANHDLIVKIDAKLDALSNVVFEKVSTKDPRYRIAKKLALTAATARAARSGLRDDEPEWEYGEWDAETEMAYQNALAKDP